MIRLAAEFSCELPRNQKRVVPSFSIKTPRSSPVGSEVFVIRGWLVRPISKLPVVYDVLPMTYGSLDSLPVKPTDLTEAATRDIPGSNK
jgi:hypothetical protein